MEDKQTPHIECDRTSQLEHNSGLMDPLTEAIRALQYAPQVLFVSRAYTSHNASRNDYHNHAPHAPPFLGVVHEEHWMSATPRVLVPWQLLHLA